MKYAQIVRLAGTSLLAVGLIIAAGCGKKVATPAPVETLKNLQTAFNGESNAHAMYAAFAKKADAEGYGKVASLFRAASMSEKIHAANHAKVIRSMGAEPKTEMNLPEIKTTAENLTTALTGETYELTTMYPNFLAQAQADGSDAAVQTFSWSLAAEKEHAKFYKAALDDLPSWKEGTKTFIVCQKCGYTTDNIGLTKCPVCGEPEKGLKEVS